MTRKFWTLIGLAYALIFLGLVILKPGPLLLALPLVIYLGTAIWFTPKPLQLSATRHLSRDSVERNKPVIIILEITNQGGDTEEIRLEDDLPPGLQLIDGQATGIFCLRAGEKAQIQYTVQAERGMYRWQYLRVTTHELLSIMQIRQTLESYGQLLVLPDVNPIRQVTIRPGQTRGFAGPIPARMGGSGTDFWGVREYQMGDPLRKINWRISARHRIELYTNEFEQERIADVGLILDARHSVNLVTPVGALFEHSVLAAASLSQVFLQDGNRVSLLVYGFGIDRVFPGYCKVQQERILRVLARARTGTNYALESLNYLPTRLFPARSQLVIISPLGVDDVSAYIRLRA